MACTAPVSSNPAPISMSAKMVTTAGLLKPETPSSGVTSPKATTATMIANPMVSIGIISKMNSSMLHATMERIRTISIVTL